MHVQGICDLFTTKPIGIDRKLYKRLDRRYSVSKQDSSDALSPPQKSKGRSNSDSKVIPKNQKESSIKDRSDVDSVKSTEGSQFISPQFMQLKKRSYSYSYPYTRPQLSKYLQSSNMVGKNGKKDHKHSNSILGSAASKRRAKSFHYSLTDDMGSTFDTLRANRDTETLDYYSPFGPLSQQSSRRLFAYLIAILNSTYPDHDFSTVQPDNFTLLKSPEVLVKRVNSLLISLGKSSGLDWIWQTIDTHMDIEKCTCFQYEPEQSFLNDLPGTLWCNMYFMYNKKRKRVAFLYFRATTLQESKNALAEAARHHEERLLDTVPVYDENVFGDDDDEDAIDENESEEKFKRFGTVEESSDVVDPDAVDPVDPDSAIDGDSKSRTLGSVDNENDSNEEAIDDDDEDEESPVEVTESQNTPSDDDGSDYMMDEEELANENQDDEDDYGGVAASEGMDID